MDDEPYVGSLEGWNAAHSMSGDPLDFLDRLKVKWHAYAREDKAFPSTFLPEFWKIDRSFDRTHAVITNYLLRFDVNPSDTVSTIPFEVYLQREVTQIELTIYSNIEALSGQYRFVVE